MTFRRTNPNGPFEDLEQASQQLSGGVFTYEGSPVLVHHVEPHADGVGRVIFDYLGESGSGKSGVRKMINSPSFKRFKPFTIGFVNLPEEQRCVFTSRRPIRSTRAGLYRDSLNIASLDGRVERTSRGGDYDFRSFTNAPSFRDMVLDRYPVFDEALAFVNQATRPGVSAAFHKDWAVSREENSLTWLYRRTEKIAIMSDRGVILLRGARHYADEMREIRAIPPVAMEI